MRILREGLISHSDARKWQIGEVESLIASRSESSEVCLLCQHPPILTVGNRCSPAEKLSLEELSFKQGWAFAETERGGEASFFCPGMLMVYPVVSLKSYKIGVKRFVQAMLGVLCKAIESIDREGQGADTSKPFCKAESPGVWFKTDEGDRKVASVGFRIRQGVSDYGLSLNVSADMPTLMSERAEKLRLCGLSPSNYSCLESVLSKDLSVEEVSDLLETSLSDWRTLIL